MKKKITIGILIVIVILTLGIVGINFSNKKEKNKDLPIKEESTEVIEAGGILSFLKAISGVKADNIEIIDNPIGFKGELFVPDEAIVKGINYFLQETHNDKMQNLSIESKKGIININVDYKVTNTIKTPIELKIKPTLDGDKDLVINIEEVKFLDLKIAQWIVNIALNNFIEDWFPKNGDLSIDFNKGSVIIYKDNFKGLELNNISLENGLEIQVVADLKSLLN